MPAGVLSPVHRNRVTIATPKVKPRTHHAYTPFVVFQCCPTLFNPHACINKLKAARPASLLCHFRIRARIP